MYSVPKNILDDISSYVPEKDWSMTKAQEWSNLLKKHAINIKPAWLFIRVRDNYKIYNVSEHLASKIFTPPLIKWAQHKLCENKYHQVVFLSREQIDHELESLDSYYCPTCNAFWQEP